MGRILTITGYSESGRHSLVERLLREHPTATLIKSVTTRDPSKSDLPGMYKHIEEDVFTVYWRLGTYLWSVAYQGLREQPFRYATEPKYVDRILRDEHAIGIMLLKPEGVIALRQYLRKKGCLDVHTAVFLEAPPDDIHRRRLKSRNISLRAMTRAFHKAKEWKEAAAVSKKEGLVPYHFIKNDGRISVVANAVNALLV